MNKEELTNEVITFANKNNYSLSQLISFLKEHQKQSIEDEIITNCETNAPLLEKCYYHNHKYYKVVSNRYAPNPHMVECLVFDEHPSCSFIHPYNMVYRAGDNYLGEFEFTSFCLQSILVRELSKFQEITNQEYWFAARTYINRLSCMDWSFN